MSLDGFLLLNEGGTWNGGQLAKLITVIANKILNLSTGNAKTFIAGSGLTNNGTLDWQDGQITWDVSFPTITNNGTFTISGNNNTQEANGGLGTIINNGTIAKTSTGTTGLNYLTLTNAGTVKGLGTYNLSPSTFNSNGNLAPGLSPDIMTFNGAQPLSSGSTLQIEMLDGTGPGTGHDQLQRNGNLTLAGNITVTADPGVPNGTYTIIDLTSGDISGTFSSETLPSGYTLEIDLTNDEVKVTKAPLVSLATHYFRSIATGELVCSCYMGKLTSI